MSIIRAPRPATNFYTLDKRISEDARLSWAARGLLIFLLGKPDNWKVSIQHLRNQTATARIRTGRDAIYSLLRELESVGYLRAKQQRSADGRGFGEIDYLVSEAVLPRQADTRNANTSGAETPDPTLVRIEEAPIIQKEEMNESIKKSQAEVAPKEAVEAVNFEWPAEWDLDRETFEDFKQHCDELGKPLTSSSWKHTRQDLQELWGKGIDLNESLHRTMQIGMTIPVDPSRGKKAAIERRLEARQRLVEQDVRWSDRTVPPPIHDHWQSEKWPAVEPPMRPSEPDLPR